MDAGDRASAGPRTIGSGDERRLTVRAYHRWTGLLGGRSCPPVAAAPELLALPEFSPHLIVLERSDEWVIRVLGARLAQVCGGEPGSVLADAATSSLLAGIARACAQVIERSGPAELESCASELDGQAILYRGILLPFASEQNAIEQVAGVVSWAINPAGGGARTPAAPLPDRKPRHPPVLPRAAPLMSWADGPMTAGSGEQGALARRLRALPAVSPADLAPLGSEFSLLLARRGRNGEPALLGEVPEDRSLLERAARLLLA